jgi:hypothetical protein
MTLVYASWCVLGADPKLTRYRTAAGFDKYT